MTSRSLPQFHGTSAEVSDLITAMEHNCTCNRQATPPIICSVHDALIHDQRFLNNLLFMRRIKERIEASEHRRQ